MTDSTAPGTPTEAFPPPGRDLESTVERLELLEARVQALGQAVRALIQGLEDLPDQEPDPDRVGRAARLAHELLLAKGL
ncbi:hypothetical protein ACFVHB_09955 [Kitasatospora sp. NPDC127111]|uniref:hypothetical protein n=1 Tax=Kitasatospora sp. NPDC127111 TaxID=3345363 RepID=UPI003630C4B2